MMATTWGLARLEHETKRAREAGSEVTRAYHTGIAAGLYERMIPAIKDGDPLYKDAMLHLSRAAALCVQIADLRGEALRRAAEGMRLGRAIMAAAVDVTAEATQEEWVEA